MSKFEFYKVEWKILSKQKGVYDRDFKVFLIEAKACKFWFLKWKQWKISDKDTEFI